MVLVCGLGTSPIITYTPTVRPRVGITEFIYEATTLSLGYHIFYQQRERERGLNQIPSFTARFISSVSEVWQGCLVPI